MNKHKYTSEISQQILTEWNDGATLEHLRAIKWEKVESKIELLMDKIEITEKQAKEELHKWYTDMGFDSDYQAKFIFNKK